MKNFVSGLVVAASVICMTVAIVVRAGEQQAPQKKSLIAYYSFTGKTELVAKTLAGILEADLLKIEDVTKPTMQQAYGEGRDASLQGKAWPIKSFKADLSGYDRVFVGCPVWFSMPTPEFNAFVDQVSFTGKQVVVFVTYGGGGQDAAIRAMTAKVTAKGGKVVSSFSVKTGKATDDNIMAKAKDIAKQY